MANQEVKYLPLTPFGYQITRSQDQDGGYIYQCEQTDSQFDLSNLHHNRTGILGTFSFSWPIDLPQFILSSITLNLSRQADRQRFVRSLHDAPTTFQNWEDLFDSICADAIAECESKEVFEPIIESVSDILSAKDQPEPAWRTRELAQAKGLIVLGGMPKLGKSVQVLQWGKAIATGASFLDRDCIKAKVLILALEDTKLRLAQRMTTMGITPDMGIDTIREFPAMPGALQVLRELITTRNYGVVFIDTTKRIMPGIDENKGEFGDACAALQALALELSVSIILVHHFTKRPFGDVLTDLRGHGSFGAVMDTGLGLYPDTTPGHYTLKTVSRDADSLVLDLFYDKPSLYWSIDHDYQEVLRIEGDSKILNILSDFNAHTEDTAMTIKDICENVPEGMSNDRHAIDTRLKRLIENGDIQQTTKKVGYQTAYAYYLT